MADVRVAPNMVLSDGTTLSQLAAVDSSGRLSVSLTASSATVTVDSELSAAAALADATANPTVTSVGAFNSWWNGATWDRAGGTTTGAFVQGNVAADAAVSARPLLGGGRASSAIPTAMSADGDAVSLWVDRSGGTIVNGRDAHDAALDANTNPQLVGGRASAAAPTDVSADGDATRLWVLRSGAVASVLTAAGALIGGDATNGLDVDVTRVTGTVTVDSELPAAAALADATANPTVPAVGGFLMGYNGTTWDRVRTANTGRLQVDVITGGSSDTPTNPIVKTVSITALAAGSSSTTELRTVDLGGSTKKLTKVTLWSSVPYKADLQTVANGAGTSFAVTGGQAGIPVDYTPPGDRTGRNYFSVAHPANAGFDGWQVIATNLDPSEAADIYATIYYED